MFPVHKCSLHLIHNQHKDYYETCEKYLKDSRDDMEDWKNEECRKRAIETNELWELTWYPTTPIGSYTIYAPTFEELIEFSKELNNTIDKT